MPPRKKRKPGPLSADRSTVTTIRIDTDMLAAIDTEARSRGLSRNALVRRLIGGFLQRLGIVPAGQEFDL